MNRRIVAILVIALIIATGASLMVYRMVAARVTGGAGQTTPVIVAAKDLELGTAIKESDLKSGKWAGPLPKGTVLKKEEILGRGVISAVYEGEPIVADRLALVGAGAGLAAMIPAGMRACAVKVNDVVGVAGFVVSGMRVDVLIAGKPAGYSDPSGTKVKTLLQNIEVLSAGQKFQRDAEGKPVKEQVVNLLVTPEQAELLSLASDQTHIQLALRNPLDKKQATTPGSSLSQMFNDPVKPAPKAARPRVVPATTVKPAAKPVTPIYVIEVLNGAARTEAKFERPEERP